MSKHISCAALLCALIILLSWPLQTAAFQDRGKKLDHLVPALDYLLSLIEKKSQVPFDAGKIKLILKFINSPKSPNTAYTVGERKGGTSAYHEFYINRSLREVLDLVYNPEIPSYLTSPSSVRRSHWIEVDGKHQPLPRLASALDDLSRPFIIKGVEFIENTPDTNTGAYYSYEFNRTLILMKHQGKRIFLSISDQRNISNVGKKGLVLGRDDNWDYLYTGEKGCTLKGLGWAESYMYSSSSIVVYYETKDSEPKVKCGTFKWLKAGWKGINFVKPYHLLKGIERYETSFKEIVESLALSDVSKLSNMFARIANLSMEELREKSRLYFRQLRRRYHDKSRLAQKWLTELIEKKGYIEKMKREEMEVILCIEYLKHLLGKESRFDISCFKPFSPTAKRPG